MNSCKLFVLFVVGEGCFFSVYSALLESGVSPFPPIFDKKHTVWCIFSPAHEETLTGLELYLGTKINESNVVAQLNPSTGRATWSHNVPDGLDRRGYVLGSRNDRYLQMVINKTDCSDRHRKYMCGLKVSGGSDNGIRAHEDMVPISGLSQLHIPPRGGITLTQTPNTIGLSSKVTFECSGNVGRPPGTLKWRLYFDFHRLADKTDSWKDLPGEMLTTCQLLTNDECSHEQTIRLELTLPMVTEEESDKLQGLWVECWLAHVLLDQPSKDGPCAADSNICRRSDTSLVELQDEHYVSQAVILITTALIVAIALLLAKGIHSARVSYKRMLMARKDLTLIFLHIHSHPEKMFIFPRPIPSVNKQA